MNKIGILTLYKGNRNYGGLLQAYALGEVLRNLNFDAEQIDYDFKSERKDHSFLDKVFFNIRYKTPHQIYQVVVKKITEKVQVVDSDKKDSCFKDLNVRIAAFEKFEREKIIHSECEYKFSNLAESAEKYDAYIVGSDQVWNADWICIAFFLNFVPTSKMKISYSASLGKNSLTKNQTKLFKENLKSFNAISVREEDSIELISDVSPVPVVSTLDPTLLLDKSDWDKICTERIIEEDYLFCYFLGENETMRNLAKQYAKKNNLKIVSLPHILNKYRKCDEDFADINLFNVSPDEWISLIKYASFVFTDSFHAAVFSSVYKKEYFVFHREGHKSMGSRIYTLTSLFETQERFCDNKEKETLNYIESLKPIDYSRKLVKLESKKTESIDFLIKNLSKEK